MFGELVSFGLEKLLDLLSHEHELFHGVKDQVTELQTEITTFKSFLKDGDAKKHTNKSIKSCIEEIVEVTFKVQYIIENFILKKDLGKNGRIKKRIRRFACIIPERRRLALKIGSLTKKISKVIRDMETFGVQQIFANVRDPQPSQQRVEFAKKSESSLVGLEEKVENLVRFLVEGDHVQLVSVTGMGGLGKTTLAGQDFNHDMVKNKFDRLEWVCVTQVCDRMKVWQAILQNFRPKKEEKEIRKMTEARLQDELFGLLETCKSLIVFDDIWKEEDWDLIKPIFPLGKGWKVLLTSRIESVAGRRDTHINIKPKCLNDQDSLTLFQSIAMPTKYASEVRVDDGMEEMGKKMIKHCGGLPLAIRVLEGLLAANCSFYEWK